MLSPSGSDFANDPKKDLKIYNSTFLKALENLSKCDDNAKVRLNNLQRIYLPLG